VIPYRPHTVTVYEASEPEIGGVAQAPTYTSLGTVRCQVTMEEPGAAFESYGLEVRRPHVLLADSADESKFDVGNRVYYDSRWFVVRASSVAKALTQLNHVRALLEEIVV